MSVARWRRMFDINVIGSMLCAREAVKRMSTRHGGEGGEGGEGGAASGWRERVIPMRHITPNRDEPPKPGARDTRRPWTGPAPSVILNRSATNGKPTVRWGRKATGPSGSAGLPNDRGPP